MTDRHPVFNVLFLCTGNSARSILAEAILNRRGAGRFRAFSAGSFPTGEVNRYAIELLRELDFPTEGLRSKNWSEFARPDAPELDFVLTVCNRAARESCPVWPGRPASGHWGVPDPAAEGGDEAHRRAAFRDAFRLLEARIVRLIDLPLESMDEQRTRACLAAIGEGEPIDVGR